MVTNAEKHIVRNELVSKNAKLKHSCKREFDATFGKPIDQFMHPLFGFDVIAFDEWLQTPDGTSTADHILNKYGQQAVDLCFRLI